MLDIIVADPLWRVMYMRCADFAMRMARVSKPTIGSEQIPDIGRMRDSMPRDVTRNADGSRALRNGTPVRKPTKEPGELCHVSCPACCERLYAPITPNCKQCIRTAVFRCFGEVTVTTLSDYLQLCRTNLVGTELQVKPW